MEDVRPRLIAEAVNSTARDDLSTPTMPDVSGTEFGGWNAFADAESTSSQNPPHCSRGAPGWLAGSRILGLARMTVMETALTGRFVFLTGHIVDPLER